MGEPDRPEPEDKLRAPKSASLRALFWRSEILQVLYWLRGEGFGDLVDAPMMERFLGVDAQTALTYMGRLAEEGYLTRDGDWFSLSEAGLDDGAAEFISSFSTMTRPTHGGCSADCWCEASPEEADACERQRLGGPH